MLGYNLGDIDIDFKLFDERIRQIVPLGFSVREKIHSLWYPNAGYLEGNFRKGIADVTKKLEVDHARVVKSLGTLGGGK